MPKLNILTFSQGGGVLIQKWQIKLRFKNAILNNILNFF